MRASVDLSSGAIWALARFGSYGIDGTRELAQEQSVEDERVQAVEAGAARARPGGPGDDGAS